MVLDSGWASPSLGLPVCRGDQHKHDARRANACMPLRCGGPTVSFRSQETPLLVRNKALRGGLSESAKKTRLWLRTRSTRRTRHG